MEFARRQKPRKHQPVIHIYENVHSKVRHSNGTVFNCRRESFFSARREKKAARCLDNGWLDFPRRNIATFSDIRIHFCPFYRALIGFAAVYLRCKGRWKFRKNRLSAWNAVKFVVLPMEGSRIAISGYLIHFLIKRYGNSVVTVTNGTWTFRTFNGNTYL